MKNSKSRFRFLSRRSWIGVLALCAGAIFIFPHLQAQAAYFIPKLASLPSLDLSKYPIVQQGKTLSIPFLAIFISEIYRLALGVGIIAAAVMLVWGGFRYIVGSTLSDVTRAKQIITDAIVGLVLLFCGYALLQILNPQLTNLKPLQIEQISPHVLAIMAAGDTTPADVDTKNIPKANKVLGPSALQKIVPEVNKGGTAAAAPVPEGPTSQAGGAPAPEGGAIQGGDIPKGSTAGEGKTPIPWGVTDKYGNEGCASSPYTYTTTRAKCGSKEDCANKYCTQDSNELPDNFPDVTKLANFAEFPGAKRAVGAVKTDEARAQIEQFGIFLSGRPCFPKCKLSGQGAYAPEGIFLRPEVKAALLKAGQIAKSKGYYLRIVDAGRTFALHKMAFCQRVKSGSLGGLTPPGGSPHNSGVAVDVMLSKLDGDYEMPLTPVGLNQQVEVAKSLGVNNVFILQDIMAQAGFRRMCQELWHFDYGGVYGLDCFRCVFPPTPERKK
ncbi:MAG: hypothetical protein WC641_01335 [Patescibacteria group bacterium]